ncbi:YokU family protein [Peribacillus cavernae]|uniref:YokU family protein n=2 Tax=Peribacillus cavernae TaxID=1674310 RepID=A0A3S0VIN4_9BACI|nr:YokU family protein [Peribacillus cavernae]RUQ32856.1 YokU family protein [Peribacillus cavernae]
MCPWCKEGTVVNTSDSVYWELPDGTKAIEITDTPSKQCDGCGACFQDDDIVKEIEDQLFLINTAQLAKAISFDGLMKLPRLLKRNYFDFS